MSVAALDEAIVPPSSTVNGESPRMVDGAVATILVVEDSKVQREMIARVLSRQGLQVLRAADGAAALAAIRGARHVDLMILDYELPDMSGDQVVDELSRTNELPPFVVSTARGNERVAVEMMKRGAVDYLSKDEQLIAALPGIVERLLRQLKMNRIVAEVEEALRRSEQRLREIIDSTADAFISITPDGAILEWNQAAQQMFGLRRDQALGSDAIELMVPPERRAEIRDRLHEFNATPRKLATRLRHEAAAMDHNGRVFPVEVSLSTLDVGGEWVINAFIQDISRRRELESQLVQSEKMASLGQLAAGVAHEINNPIAYVRSNVKTLQDYISVFTALIGHYEECAAAVDQGDLIAAKAAVQHAVDLRNKEKYSAIIDDVDELFEDSEEGLVRVKEIVQNLKSFARLDEADVKEADLNECLDTTMKVVNNELKYKATVHRDFAELPRLRCHPGQINQVFMNLLVNAAQAIPERGDIFLKTWCDEANVYVSVRDTGTGIKPEHLSSLFTPFFTTKPVGSGTGLGLSISYGIVQKHLGEITVDSQYGVGTTFTIRLPRSGMS